MARKPKIRAKADNSGREEGTKWLSEREKYIADFEEKIFNLSLSDIENLENLYQKLSDPLLKKICRRNIKALKATFISNFRRIESELEIN